ncbi:single-stranded DNA-binding protein [Treponema primitia]|uniref:single-stranded DNA-binding protein n=1 Tax=Treponema primitia TaxID=88058 RepID=UPI0002555870|nr:single-stranded DNA-binding protein [Treponema primitia]
MNSINSIIIEGNLVRDPDLRSTTKGTSVCKFDFASNRFFKQGAEMEKEVSYFTVETWGKLAEQANNLGHKGRGVRVVGRLKQDRWNDGQGKTQSKIVIVAEHLEFRPEFKRNEDSAEETSDEDEKLVAGF